MTLSIDQQAKHDEVMELIEEYAKNFSYNHRNSISILVAQLCAKPDITEPTLPPMPNPVIKHEKLGALFDRMQMHFYAAKHAEGLARILDATQAKTDSVGQVPVAWMRQKGEDDYKEFIGHEAREAYLAAVPSSYMAKIYNTPLCAAPLNIAQQAPTESYHIVAAANNALAALQSQLLQAQEENARLVAEVDRLNKWADSFTDSHLKERQTGDALIKEVQAENARLKEKVESFDNYISLLSGKVKG